jgi:hypothetical protein
MNKQAKSVKQVLKAVEWILLNVGWTKFANFRDKDGQAIGWAIDDNLDPMRYPDLDPMRYPDLGSVCINGAVQLVNCSYKLKANALHLLDESVPEGIGSAMSLNDSENSTKEVMVKLVRRAIRKA